MRRREFVKLIAGAAVGLDVPGGAELTPEALGRFQKAEIEKWYPVIKAAGVRAE